MRNMQQGFSEGPELATSPTRPQSSMEAQAKNKQRDKKEGLHLPRKDLRTPRSIASPRRPHWHQEALQQKTWREEVEV